MAARRPGRPAFTAALAHSVLADHWGIEGTLSELPSDSDLNFRVDCPDGRTFVLRFANAQQDSAFLEALVDLLGSLDSDALGTQEVEPTGSGDMLSRAEGSDGTSHLVWLTGWIDFRTLASVPTRAAPTLVSLGGYLARLDAELEDFQSPALRRVLDWDLARGAKTVQRERPALDLSHLTLERSDLTLFDAAFEDHMERYESLLQLLPRATVHNDPNDHNVLVSPATPPEVVGILDFGDAVESLRIADLAIGATYAMLGSPTPVQVVRRVVEGYARTRPLDDLEAHLLWPLIRLRLLISTTMAARATATEPDNPYLRVSQSGAWQALRQLASVDFDRAADGIDTAGRWRPSPAVTIKNSATLGEDRVRRLAPSLSLSYDEPLHIVRGWMQYLFDSSGRAYLDCVNNVCHVGHSHPRVVRAITRQASLLNTNSRYLHDVRVEYAERLIATLPSELDTCFFVSSGTEANELALRIARAATGREAVVVIDGAYHGNASATVGMSPYKFDGPGGHGRPRHVHVAPMPDVYRGACRDSGKATDVYLSGVREALDRAVEHGGAAALFAEPILSCGGQIVPPPGYVSGAFMAAREAGAVAVADEVQTGFGRVGSAFWAFALDGALPDIVTMGKPMGNGHPLGAVVVRRSLAEAFNNGMEYFASFGGNPVSCAAGLSVLDVIRDERLQANAREVGEHLTASLRSLAQEEARIGDIRGSGLFVGVELVETESGRAVGERHPDAELAHRVVQECKEAGVLLSADGPDHNVIKIKPPLVFTRENVDTLVAALRGALGPHV